VRRACRYLSLSRSSWHYHERKGWKVGPKLVQQVRRLEGLRVKGKKPRRKRGGTATALPTKGGSANEVWSWDFVNTRTETGVPFKLLTLIDEYTRQYLAIRAQRRLRTGDILDALTEEISERGVPQCMRSDNGSEFMA
jgi:putative transposase